MCLESRKGALFIALLGVRWRAKPSRNSCDGLYLNRCNCFREEPLQLHLWLLQQGWRERFLSSQSGSPTQPIRRFAWTANRDRPVNGHIWLGIQNYIFRPPRYKGVLDDKRMVAVKKLANVIEGGEEFWAEVTVIGKIYHMNLVRMWGFCSEGSHKLLVYEHVKNGSLDKHLFRQSKHIKFHAMV